MARADLFLPQPTATHVPITGAISDPSKKLRFTDRRRFIGGVETDLTLNSRSAQGTWSPFTARERFSRAPVGATLNGR
jgi:hypothetical protein